MSNIPTHLTRMWERAHSTGEWASTQYDVNTDNAIDAALKTAEQIERASLLVAPEELVQPPGDDVDTNAQHLVWDHPTVSREQITSFVSSLGFNPDAVVRMRMDVHEVEVEEFVLDGYGRPQRDLLGGALMRTRVYLIE